MEYHDYFLDKNDVKRVDTAYKAAVEFLKGDSDPYTMHAALLEAVNKNSRSCAGSGAELEYIDDMRGNLSHEALQCVARLEAALSIEATPLSSYGGLWWTHGEMNSSH